MDEILGGKHGGVKPIPTVVPTPTQYQDASDNGFRALWVVFVVMVVASAVFSFRAWSIPVSKRLYHVITTLITITAAISYFAMASGHATNHDVCRQVFWARYVDWSITTPLLLLDLCLLA